MQEIAGIIQATVSIFTFVILLINFRKSQQIYHATNSMKDELVSEVRKSSLAKGRLDQKSDDVKKEIKSTRAIKRQSSSNS